MRDAADRDRGTERPAGRQPLTAMKTLSIFSRPIAAIAIQLCLAGGAAADGEDNFNDNAKDPAKWGADDVTGYGLLTEAGQQLRYTCTIGTLEDFAERPWNLTRFPYNADWEIMVEASNFTVPSPPFQVSSMGITLLSPLSASEELYHEFYNSALVAGPDRSGFSTQMSAGGVHQGGADSSDLSIDRVAMRIAWNSATKVLTSFYDIDPSDGYQWIELTSFGLSAAGGGTAANADWGLADSDRFFISLYGYSAAMSVSAGQMYLDNFKEVGGVSSGSGTRPQPVGHFPFAFPSGNPALTRILSITGNYQGISPSPGQRSYTIDAAQDEAGKISAIGVVEGIEDVNGNATIAANVGSVKTVNEEPVALLKGSFKGELDDLSTTFKGNASVPVDVVDLGAGEQGVQGTGSFASKLGGVPFSGKNMQVEVPAPPGSIDNLKQDWSLDLDIELKTVNGKERTVATAMLILPNGDTIQYPERVVKYSEKKGYKIAFKKGTNITANPDTLDKRSTVILTGLTFEKVGDEWEPTAGTINYKFLGQAGIEDLLEFLPP